MSRRDPDNAEGALREHAGKLPRALADGQRVRGFVPVNRDGGVDAVLVVIIVALVLIEREVAVRAPIDAQLPPAFSLSR